MSQTRVGARHWLVGTEPGTGRKALFIGRRPNNYIIGMEVADSEALLDSLWVYAAQRRFMMCHEWQASDLLMWDNISGLHRRAPFNPTSRRVKLARKSREMNGSPEASDPFLSCERAGER